MSRAILPIALLMPLLASTGCQTLDSIFDPDVGVNTQNAQDDCEFQVVFDPNVPNASVRVTAESALAAASPADNNDGFTYGRTQYLHRVQKEDAPGIPYRNYRYALDEAQRPRVRELIRAPSPDERQEFGAMFSQQEGRVSYCQQPCLAESLSGQAVTEFTIGSPSRYPSFDGSAVVQDLSFAEEGFVADTQWTISTADIITQLAFQGTVEQPDGIVFGPSLNQDVCVSICLQEWRDVSDDWCNESGNRRIGKDVFVELFVHHGKTDDTPGWMEVIGRKIHVEP